jgi:hypothetical protein
LGLTAALLTLLVAMGAALLAAGLLVAPLLTAVLLFIAAHAIPVG